MSYADQYLAEAASIVERLDRAAVESVAARLLEARERGGRLFFLGVGGSAANASHAVNDFRKIADFEAYAPTDNVAELTARINDDGWETTFADWLRGSRLTAKDLVFVLSVGGGDLERNVSPNLVRALEHARSVGATICGMVGRDGGYTAKVADACVIVPTVSPSTVTPHTEAFQAVVLAPAGVAPVAAESGGQVGIDPLMARAVFLDRDGVLNRTEMRGGAPRPPATLAELELLPGVPEALGLLAAEGLRLVVVTNQPDVARGAARPEDVEAIHAHLLATLPLDAVFACFHDEGDGCDCRKPRPGMLRAAAAAHAIELTRSFMVGDRWRDVEAGRAAGCETFLLAQPWSERERCSPDHVAPDLLSAAREIARTIAGASR